MGGRGASSGFYKLNGVGNAYGDEYASVIAPFGSMKFVARRDKRALKAPDESMTPGRVYVTVRRSDGKMHSIAFIGSDGKKYKQIDVQDHRGMGSHVHEGRSIADKPRGLSSKERRLFSQARAYIRSKGGVG